MKLFLILLIVGVVTAAHVTKLTEKHWENFGWKTNAVLERIDEKFEDDYKRAYIEYKNRDVFSPGRREAVMTRYEILDEIRLRNKYAFLAPWSKHILTTDKVKYVKDTRLYGDPEKEEEEYWEEVAKNYQEAEEVDQYLFDAKDHPSPIDLDKDEDVPSCGLNLGTGDTVGFDNDLIRPYYGDMSEISESNTVITPDDN